MRFRPIQFTSFSLLLCCAISGFGQRFVGPASIGSVPAAQIIAADVNHDGNADLVYIVSSSNNIAVQLSNGDGTFRKPVLYPAGNTPSAIAVGDFNGDGKLDIVVTESEVAVLHGNGDGTFQSPTLYNVVGIPISVAVGDFNNDGRPDIATLSRDKHLTILTNTGTGFTGRTRTVTTYFDGPGGLGGTDFTFSLVAGDFNRDGRMDLAYVDGCGACDVSQEKYFVSFNSGNGFKDTLANIGTFTGSTSSLRAVDVDLDGKADLVTAFAGCRGQCPGSQVLYSNGDGTFSAVTISSGGSTDPFPLDAIVGDFNNDGIMDVALVVSSSESPINFAPVPPALAIYTGKGGRSGFRAPVKYPFANTAPFSSAYASQLTAGFFKHDGRMDIATNGNPNPPSTGYYFLNLTSEASDPCIHPTKAGVHVCSPLNGSTIKTNSVHFLASARAATQPLNRIELWIDGHKVFQEFNDRLDTKRTVANGLHTAAIIEVDATGAFIKQIVKFTVKAPQIR